MKLGADKNLIRITVMKSRLLTDDLLHGLSENEYHEF